MNKTDNRHYNRAAKRILSLEMQYWIWWHGKITPILRENSQGEPVGGLIINVEYHGNSVRGTVSLTFENGTIYSVYPKSGNRPKIEDLEILQNGREKTL